MLAEKLQKANLDKPRPNILVIGDLMLDHYIFGNATRLSPEAPVPVVNVQRERKIVGGAANVASNLVDLGASVTLAGVLGNDTFGSEIIGILEEKQIQTSLILKDETRKTTVKTRVIAGTHQIVRIDTEDIHDISNSLHAAFLAGLDEAIENTDIVILSDYNKGLLTPELSLAVIARCDALGKKIIVDPKGLDYSKYNGAYLIKPNRKELAEAAKMPGINSQADLESAAANIFECTMAAYLIVTLSEGGIAIITPETSKILPVVATEVYDVTGAGDTVMATLAYCLSLGFDIEDACRYANFAASIVIRQIGSATTSIEEIINAIKNTRK
jgi:rfaE bifunctional protein kinase chain/domain